MVLSSSKLALSDGAPEDRPDGGVESARSRSGLAGHCVGGLLLCSSQHMPRAACACMGIGQGSGRTARWFQSGHLRTIASMMGDVAVAVGGVGSTLGILDGDRLDHPI